MQVIKEYEGNIGDGDNSGAVISRIGKRQLVGTNIANVTPPTKKAHSTANRSIPQSLSSQDHMSSRRISMSPGLPSILRTQESTSTINVASYDKRKEPGKTIFAFNPKNMEGNSSNLRKNKKCAISYSEYDTNVKESYQHMFTTIEERAQALENHLIEMGDFMIERYNLGEKGENDESDEIAGLEDVGVPRQDKICCIGRICNSVS